jgi:hypothetical protein
LKYPNGIGCAQDRFCTREPNAFGSLSDRGKDDRWGRDSKIEAVVFSNAEHVEPHPIKPA